MIRVASYFSLVPVLLCLLTAPSSSQVTFQRTYGGSDWDEAYSIQQTQDGGYIVVGMTQSFGAGDFDVYAIKIDTLGDTVWTRTYGGADVDIGSSVLETPDGGYMIAGYTYSFGAGDADIYLVRTDSQGDTLGTRTYGGSLTDRAYCISRTADGGYIISGDTWSQGAGMGDYFLLKVDSLGDSLWSGTYGGSNREFCYSVQQTQNGGYIVAGHTQSFGAGDYDFYLVKTDSIGNQEWSNTYGGTMSDGSRAVHVTPDGGYAVVGYTSSFGAGVFDAYFVKTDSLGATSWDSTYGGPDWDGAFSIEVTQDGGYIIAGHAESFGSGGRDIYAVRLDSLGNTIWDATYGGSGNEEGYAIQGILDGGYVIAGRTNSFGAGHFDAYLVKTDSNGVVFLKDAGVIGLPSPPDTVLTDSTYPVTAAVQNLANTLLSFDVVATIDGYVDTVHVQDLEPDSSVQVAFTDWLVPPADSTNYVMTVCTHVSGDVDTSNDCAQKTIFAYNPTGIEEGPSTFNVQGPAFALLQNEPNPFSGGTIISYSLPYTTHVTLDVYDLSGRVVRTLINETKKAGIHRVTLEIDQKTAGVYFYRLGASDFESTRKMVLID
jgi:hypothetical protein